ncbi:MAG: hypothetical protein UX09_C0037G0003 [Candidatus Uhrbacteria bacterium GW2011_GWE2_45_35]|uniref:Uncharacterized protein n=1 Tax=Candidatus Uhrbacteria bacterium GW2011_GWE2_45_35 TaxID=1618993 RepID=A0A0G1MFS8_9BACT|nr:MAG: hypothetical protein UX09_C0037G0003 [Candidatus Uhrbacteria bacterium GW2011_GWE2_45_35]HBR80981.1 hypothetical protein [Candidatus Uhrbacteria bacterium]HCU31930.1 hypothetical protein [Candidatus Uhrbacteria bacterium]
MSEQAKNIFDQMQDPLNKQIAEAAEKTAKRKAAEAAKSPEDRQREKEQKKLAAREEMAKTTINIGLRNAERVNIKKVEEKAATDLDKKSVEAHIRSLTDSVKVIKNEIREAVHAGNKEKQGLLQQDLSNDQAELLVWQKRRHELQAEIEAYNQTPHEKLPEVAPAIEPQKKPFFSGLKKWGLMVLAAVGLGTVVHETAPQLKEAGDRATQTMDYAANSAADRNVQRIGLERAARSAREVEYVRDQVLAGIERTTQEQTPVIETTPEVSTPKTTPTPRTETFKNISEFDNSGYQQLLKSELKTANALDIPALRNTVLKEQIQLFQKQRAEKQDDLQIALGILNAGVEGPRIEETKKAVAEYVGRQAAMSGALENLQTLDEVEKEAKLASMQKDLDKLIEKRANLRRAVENLTSPIDVRGKTEQLLRGEEVEISGKKVRLDTNDLNS